MPYPILTRHSDASDASLRQYEQYNEYEGAYSEYNNQRNETQAVDYSSCQHPLSPHLSILVRLLSVFVVNRYPRLQQIQYTCQRLIV